MFRVKHIAAAIVLAGAVCLIGCSKRSGESGGYGMPDTDVSPESAFRFVAGLSGADAIPASVTDLQGDGAQWMDVSVRCRFYAPDDIIDAIIASGYESAEWDDVKAEMAPGPYTKRFSPKWAPEDIAPKECYIRRVGRESSLDVLYLVVDRERGIVYAVGESNVR